MNNEHYESLQKKIVNKIKDSFILRKKSNKMLELAKTAVEVAIKYGEEKAMDILVEKVNG